MFTGNDIDSSILYAIAECCPDLRLLDIRDSNKVQDGLQQVLNSAPNLRELRVRNDEVSDDFVRPLATHPGTNLRVVDMQQCVNLSFPLILRILQNLGPHLRILNISHIPFTVEQVAQLKEVIYQLPHWPPKDFFCTELVRLPASH